MKKKLRIIVGVVVILTVLYASTLLQTKKADREFDIFNSAQLSGRIIKIDRYSRASNFILDNNPEEFGFYPYTDKNLNNGEIFSRIAKVGDSVYKPAFSDTLALIRAEGTYLYTFQKKSDWL
ncbi:MAG: hypothetical protein JNL72_06380 [Flavipsychrobacter sp.]|nr:hypothetical protein [Flavipsychrobacter sp.]